MSENKEFLEEAIKHFKSLQKRYIREHNGKMCTKVAVALEAMEKKVPKKPMQYISDRADTPYVAYKCSVCKSEEELYEYQPYCSECGNKIDWSDFE